MHYRRFSAPTFSSCCSYTLKQGSSAADAATTTVLDLDYESLYVYCDTVGKNHTPVAISGTEPTCTVPGSADSTQCSKCGLYLIGPETLYKSHQYDQQVADEKFLKSAATCKNAAVYYCSCVCGKFSTYASTFSYGEPLPHTPQILSGSAPTCETDGLTDGSRCSVCHTTIVAQNKIPATGHSYSTASFAWAENMTSASAAAQCHCGHEENVVCMLAWDSSVKGKLVVTAAAIFDETTFSESKEIVSSVNDSTITINLPHEITGLKVIAAAYNSNGQMTDCEIPQINGTSIQLTLRGRELRVFFLVGQYCPISPAMVL